MSNLLVIDATRRDLPVFMASVTEAIPTVVGYGQASRLVLRNAMDLGSLCELGTIEAGLPVLVLGEGYSARSSCGYVALHNTSYPAATPVEVVGLRGFPWMHHKGLKPVRPVKAYLVSNCAAIKRLPSTPHANGRCRQTRKILISI